MYRRPSKRKQFIKRLIIYAFMIVSIVSIVVGIVLFTLGYRLDSEKGRLEQGALLQYDTQPPGAYVTVDGVLLGARTPTKSSVLAGTHTVNMSFDKYETWTKTVNVTAGTLTWLDYARLIPKNRPVETLTKYDSLYSMLAAPDRLSLIIQKSSTSPTFDVVDLRSEQIKTTTITLPDSMYSEATNSSIVHNFTLDRWDIGGRYALIRHTYGESTEWIVLDTQVVTNSKNVTRLLDLDLSELRFSGTSGTTLYGLSNGTIRKLDLSAATISRPLATLVDNFDLFETNIITYTGLDPDDHTKHVAGMYRDGDDSYHILKSTSSSDGFHIATTKYFNDDFVAISTDKEVTILKGVYPRSSKEDTTSLKPYATFSLRQPVATLSFSPSGDYLVAQSGAEYTSYDIEHMLVDSSTVVTTAGTEAKTLKWIDDAYLFADNDNDLTLREYDGTNIHSINAVASGYDTTLSKNGRFIYSIGKTETGYTLQRVTLIL